jgi:hypothetical protein
VNRNSSNIQNSRTLFRRGIVSVDCARSRCNAQRFGYQQRKWDNNQIAADKLDRGDGSINDEDPQRRSSYGSAAQVSHHYRAGARGCPKHQKRGAPALRCQISREDGERGSVQPSQFG